VSATPLPLSFCTSFHAPSSPLPPCLFPVPTTLNDYPGKCPPALTFCLSALHPPQTALTPPPTPLPSFPPPSLLLFRRHLHGEGRLLHQRGHAVRPPGRHCVQAHRPPTSSGTPLVCPTGSTAHIFGGETEPARTHLAHAPHVCTPFPLVSTNAVCTPLLPHSTPLAMTTVTEHNCT